MKYIDRIALYEADKSRFIDKNENLTDVQKEEIKAFFKKHNDQDGKIEWQNSKSLTYNDFFKVMKDFNERFLPKLTLSDLKEGVDYVFITEDEEFQYYFIKTYKASVAFASNNIGEEVWSPLCNWYKDNSLTGEKTNWKENVIHDYPQRINDQGKVEYGGAKWCISINHTDKFWKQYTSNNFFIFAISNYYSYDYEHKYAIQVSNNSSYFYIEDIFNAFDIKDTHELIKYTLYKDEVILKITNIMRNIVTEQEEEKARKKQELENYKNSLPTKNFSFNGYDFSFFQVGERPEGKVFMSRYLTNIGVPFSPRYEGKKYDWGCNRWDISIVRQWLNSDAPAGQWYQEYEVEGYKVDWNNTLDYSKYTKDFINNTPGFLRMVGISKSDLNPVTNVTYTTEGEPIETVDYVWIPSLSEMSTLSNCNEGEPLEYWKKILGNNANFYDNKNRIILNCENKQPGWYWLRSTDSDCSDGTRCIYLDGSAGWSFACSTYRVAALACFKD